MRVETVSTWSEFRLLHAVSLTTENPRPHSTQWADAPAAVAITSFLMWLSGWLPSFSWPAVQLKALCSCDYTTHLKWYGFASFGHEAGSRKILHSVCFGPHVSHIWQEVLCDYNADLHGIGNYFTVVFCNKYLILQLFLGYRGLSGLLHPDNIRALHSEYPRTMTTIHAIRDL